MLAMTGKERKRRAKTPGEHPGGVYRVLGIVALVAGLSVIPYCVRGLETFRALGPGRPPPLSKLFARRPRVTGLASAFFRAEPIETDGELLLASAPLPSGRVQPQPVQHALISPEAAAERLPISRIDPEAFGQLSREIEDERRSMRHLYAKLGRLAAGQSDEVVRIALYGTSTNGADRMSSRLRRLLQQRFGDGGKGFVPVAAGWRYQRHQDVRWEFDAWRTYVVNRHKGPLNRYGLGGVVAVNRNKKAWARIGTVGASRGPSPSVGQGVGHAVSRFQFYYQAFPGGGRVEVQVDEGAVHHIETHSRYVEDRVHTIDVRDGDHAITLRASEEGASEEGTSKKEDLRLYGVVLERAGPGVVVDGLSLIGAFTQVLLHFDEAHLAEQIRKRQPDLLAFWLGANDAVARTVAFRYARYVQNYREVLRRFRHARSAASCLVISILDKGEQRDGSIRTRTRVPAVVAAQREAAHAEGCAFFDLFSAMGGHGTMARWFRARPRLVTPDLGHLTKEGSKVIGTLLYRSMLKGFDDWIASGAPEGSPR